jgi:hypothetical protein
MNRKQFILLLVLAALVGSAGLIVYRHNHGAWESSGTAIGGKLLPGLSINDVAQIHIQSGTNTLLLARRDNLWRVRERGDYPANFSQISDLLLKCAGLKAVQSLTVGPSQLGRLDLLPPGSPDHAATLVEFKDQTGKTLATILLGKKHLKPSGSSDGMDGLGAGGWPDGRYVMTGAGSDSVAVISDPLDTIQPQPEQWLNKDFLSIEKPSAIDVQFAVATNSWKLKRSSETNEWQLADAQADEKLDPSKLSSVTSPFSSPGFNDAEPLSANANSQASNTILTVDTFEGLTYVARIGSAKDGDYPVSFSISAKPSAPPAAADKAAAAKLYDQWVYFIPSYAVDEMLKTRSQLLVQETNSVPAVSAK